MRRAVYPGTFDPFTEGHLDIADRARQFADHLTILVAVNPEKNPAAEIEERAAAVRAALPSGWTNVDVVAWAGLTALYCANAGADAIVRGIRNASDLRHEYPLAAMNDHLGVPTLLIPARPSLREVSSTAVRDASAKMGS